MSIIINLLLIGISLSMDTFSISLSIGTFNISKNNALFFSIFVGILHFFMPIIGNKIGFVITNYININTNFLLGIILIFIGIEMILDFKKEESNFKFDIFNMVLIAISVSLDSFSTGIGIGAITNNMIISGLIFSVCAFTFTLTGLLIGKYSNSKLGSYANIFGIILLFLIGIFHIFK